MPDDGHEYSIVPKGVFAGQISSETPPWTGATSTGKRTELDLCQCAIVKLFKSNLMEYYEKNCQIPV